MKPLKSPINHSETTINHALNLIFKTHLIFSITSVTPMDTSQPWISTFIRAAMWPPCLVYARITCGFPRTVSKGTQLVVMGSSAALTSSRGTATCAKRLAAELQGLTQWSIRVGRWATIHCLVIHFLEIDPIIWILGPHWWLIHVDPS